MYIAESGMYIAESGMYITESGMYSKTSEHRTHWDGTKPGL